MKTQLFQQKQTNDFKQEITDVINSLNKVIISTDEFNSAIKAISTLCQNHAQVKLKRKKGNKICAICSTAYGGEQFQCREEDCGQIYHNECVIGELHALVSETQQIIQQCATLEQVENFEIQLKYPCKSCQSSEFLPASIQEQLVIEQNNLEQLKLTVKEQIRQQIINLKTKQSSCAICKEWWILPNLQRKIFSLEPFDDKNLSATRKIPLKPDQVEDPNVKQKETYWIRFKKCKHLFCKECLVTPLAEQISLESAAVVGKQLYSRLKCPEEECNEFIPFHDIDRILSNKFNWFVRYKHNLMMNCIKQIPQEVQFVRCLGVYKINSQNCEYQIYDKLATQINIQKEMFNTFNEGELDLSKLTTGEQKAGERLVPCGRAYQRNSEAGFDMHQFFEDIVKTIEDEEERDSIQCMLEEYEKTGVIKPEELEGQPDKNMLKCRSELCQFQICLNGCQTVHAENVCPLQGQDQPNNPVIVPIHKVVKEVKTECLYFARSDNIIVSSTSNFCFNCFRQLKVKEGIKVIDQIVPGYFLPCECSNEFKKQQPDEEQEQQDEVEEKEEEQEEEQQQQEEEEEEQKEEENQDEPA